MPVMDGFTAPRPSASTRRGRAPGARRSSHSRAMCWPMPPRRRGMPTWTGSCPSPSPWRSSRSCSSTMSRATVRPSSSTRPPRRRTGHAPRPGGHREPVEPRGRRLPRPRRGPLRAQAPVALSALREAIAAADQPAIAKAAHSLKSMSAPISARWSSSGGSSPSRVRRGTAPQRHAGRL